jgi:arsenical pump membrane protein
VLVAGLLLVGRVAHAGRLFDDAAEGLARLPGSPALLLLACLGLDSLVTAVLNLDTAAVFMTPVLIVTARRRGLALAPFLYGSVLVANAASLLLPASNLTNLLVLRGAGARSVSGATFFAHMLSVSLPALVVTIAGLLLIHRRALMSARPAAGEERSPSTVAGRREGRGVAVLGSVLAALAIVLLGNPALVVLAIGLMLLVLSARAGRLPVRRTLAEIGLPSLAALFCLSVALGTLARASSFPASLLHSASTPLTAAAAAAVSIAVNNLPAAVLLSAHGHSHTAALLLGLNVGPNLAVTGSLSALLWWRSARTAGARPSALEYSREGVPLALCALAAALIVSAA